MIKEALRGEGEGSKREEGSRKTKDSMLDLRVKGLAKQMN